MLPRTVGFCHMDVIEGTACRFVLKIYWFSTFIVSDSYISGIKILATCYMQVH